MDPELRHLIGADTNKALEIAERVWWVGHVLPDDPFQCHVYLLEQGDQSVLFDPGSRLTFPSTLRKIEQVIPFTQIRYFVCHHQDPDITAALPLIDAITEREDAVVVTHWRAHALLRHYGLKMPFWLVDQNDWRLPLVDRELKFIFTPYAHFPGAICTFDPKTGVLFSSDLFGGFTEQPTLVARGESHIEALKPFHEHYMPSNDILGYAMAQIERYPVEIIAAQHGSIIPRSLVPFLIEQLKQLDCGIYLLGQDDSDIRRLSRLNATLRDIAETMLLYRDFRDIATRLLELVQRSLPAERIDYYTALPDGNMLVLNPENRFSGSIECESPEFCQFIGQDREQWVSAHQVDPAFIDHHQCAGAFCEEYSGSGTGSRIAIPLIGPSQQRIDGFAIITLRERIPVTKGVEQIVKQLADPLQVALEREVIYREIDQEREKAYQRSIRDALTGLFTRFYMQDVMSRHCALHDRDPKAEFAAIMLDVDHFKRINDTYGHGIGDRVLQSVAALLTTSSRATDIAVRYGGEEFIVFVVGQGQQTAMATAERLRACLMAAPIDTGGKEPLAITASFGVATRAPAESLDQLIKRADTALYRAKENGRNRVEAA
ncbi:oxygen-binding di-iron domain-containing protein [Thiorhodovibrio frisius]|uniref:diguanylate cyclase n=1 Tax=Thiorhodovibrio frisius TaxID=631362 RepID=H8Z003_9GAMM|nr:diguanylate cyclase [Thiorhodovibrio frisius]EIC21176.1 diguanylate cyclase (GGDEF) domain-containing protein [Thiorhodovibrio frisius]WPL23752.1 Stalked cell differentiation-controlling protein [Thiorhodovibrio frisius]